MDTLILLSDECAELAAKFRKASELGADIAIAELQREACNLAGSLLLFGGVNQLDQSVFDVMVSLISSLRKSKEHGASCERKIAELMEALYQAGVVHGETLLELEAAKREASKPVQTLNVSVK